MNEVKIDPRKILIGAEALVKQLDDEMSRTAKQIIEATRLLALDVSEAEMDVIKAYINELCAALRRVSERHAQAEIELWRVRDELELAG
jgi:hypothetical protein